VIVTIHGKTAGSASFVNWMSFKALLRQPDEVLQTTAGCHSSIPQNYSGFSFLRDPIDHEHEKFDI
tara:strand:- start:8475 stop:8672 length:198 start_codon:yes stop_codon:yes gene_type:complete